MSEPASPPPRRRRLFGCLLLVGLGLLTLLLLEVGLRLFAGSLFGHGAETRGMVEEAAGGTVTPVPGYRGAMTVQGRECTIRISSSGLRGPDLPPRVAGEKRVLVLGDSMTFGSGVEDDETFCAALERKLSKAGDPPVRVLNAGVPAYGVREMAMRFARLDPELEPDAIVACVYIGNDFEDDVEVDRVVVGGYMLSSAAAKAVANSWRARLAMSSRVALLGERLWERFSPETGLWTEIGEAAAAIGDSAAFEGWPERGQRLECLFMDREPPGPVQAAAFARLDAAVAELQALTAGRPLLVVVLPTWRHCWPGAYELSLTQLELDPSAHRKGNTQAAVRRAAEAAGVSCLDLSEPLAAHADPLQLFIHGDYHFTVAGHEVVAKELATAVAPMLAR